VFKGGSTRPNRGDNWLELLSAVAPADLATGHTSGKRQHEPVQVIKAWGSDSAQFFRAYSTKEVLPTVEIEFVDKNPNGIEFVRGTVTLTNAVIQDLKKTVPSGKQQPSSPKISTNEVEKINFTFQRIEVVNSGGGAAFKDDWETG